jgi:hypothetical protein
MKTYIGIAGREIHSGSWLGCPYWSQSQVNNGVNVVKIHVARPNVKTMRIVAEVTGDGVRLIQNGRQVPLRVIRGRDG